MGLRRGSASNGHCLRRDEGRGELGAGVRDGCEWASGDSGGGATGAANAAVSESPVGVVTATPRGCSGGPPRGSRRGRVWLPPPTGEAVLAGRRGRGGGVVLEPPPRTQRAARSNPPQCT